MLSELAACYQTTEVLPTPCRELCKLAVASMATRQAGAAALLMGLACLPAAACQGCVLPCCNPSWCTVQWQSLHARSCFVEPSLHCSSSGDRQHGP